MGDFYCMSKERLKDAFQSVHEMKQFFNDNWGSSDGSELSLYNTFTDKDGNVYKEPEEKASIFHKSNPQYKLDDIELGINIYFWFDGNNWAIKEVNEKLKDIVENFDSENLVDTFSTLEPVLQLIICHQYFSDGFDIEEQTLDEEYEWRLHLLQGGRCDEGSYKTFIEATVTYAKYRKGQEVSDEDMKYPDAEWEIINYMFEYKQKRKDVSGGYIELLDCGHLVFKDLS